MSLSKPLDGHKLQLPLDDELTRLASYVNWPAAAAVWPSALSRHGFAYEGSGDATRCVSCGVVVDNWQRGDQPRHVHRTRSPTCPFVVADSGGGGGGQDVDDVGTALRQVRVNGPGPQSSSFRADGETDSSALPSSSASVPRRDDATTSSRPVDRSRPDFAHLRQSESARLSTFDGWQSSVVEPGELAAAGLFYTGTADRVQCASCRGCLRSWRPGDRPALEHQRNFPDCPLLRRDAVTIPDISTTVRFNFLNKQINKSPFVAYILFSACGTKYGSPVLLFSINSINQFILR